MSNIEEQLWLYGPCVGDEGTVHIGSVTNIVWVKVVSVDENSFTVRAKRGKKKQQWTFEAPDKPIVQDGKKIVFVNKDGYFRVAINEFMEVSHKAALGIGAQADFEPYRIEHGTYFGEMLKFMGKHDGAIKAWLDGQEDEWKQSE